MNKWWMNEVAYQIYPRSFKDSNDDGIGDIKGIISKLDYLKDLGIKLIWLSPVFKSPQKDYGYDISDYKDIDPMYGTLDDMDELIFQAQKRNIKIIMDLVMNHTSNQHEWFEKSRLKIEPYTDYYIWEDPVNGKEPNNWTSIFTGSAWEFDEIRKQYYLHLFAIEQPDLNFKNERVVEEIKNIMRFWLNKGIAGFRYDAINLIYKTTLEQGDKKHIFRGQEHYLNQEGNHKILNDIYKEVLSEGDYFTVGEAGFTSPEEAKLYCDHQREELDTLFTFEHTQTNYKYRWIRVKFKPKKFYKALVKYQNILDWNVLFFENHDLIRSVSQFGDVKKYWKQSAKSLALLLLTLKGTPFIYQGQEIGMTNFDYKDINETQDVESKRLDTLLNKKRVPKRLRWFFISRISRDNARTPMQWNSSKYAGFSNHKPWLKPVNNFPYINVEQQKNDSDSILNFYKDMIKYRQNSKTLREGKFEIYKITNKLMVFKRYTHEETLCIAVNLSRRKQKINLQGKLVFNSETGDSLEKYLNPYQAVILKQI